MERYIFSVPTGHGPMEAIVEQGGDCYSVHLDGRYAGSMWQDEIDGMQWNTLDEALEPYLWDIADHLEQVFCRKGFPGLLRGTYPEITSAEWKSEETLLINLKAESDLEVFTTFLKDEVLNLVSFEQHLDLMVKKENEDYFGLIGIN